ncbi:uncharacterized protein N7511_000819 [Penicillium nucicola]|uniref:uncharacterized protein n=1 Tax=Penicillium nucicola TaxID=1850975 RepID=UPI0025458E8C|nr:uncharacterized protein N7511_000819 [Penicillium nucicola]KAJ5775808.1 hypothetical protein N7511_000819 [Penicillium nucicola]
MVLTSNEKRAFLRQQCREALAAHIYDRLGLVVAPSQVRLQPSAGDGYAWSVTESKKSLLQSNLGSGNVGMYRSICEELGRSLEAVTPQTLQIAQLERDGIPREESGPVRGEEEDSGSFTAKIRELDCANLKMKNELDHTNIRLQDSLGENRTLQAKLGRLQDELDHTSIRLQESLDENRTLHAKLCRLQDEMDHSSSRATRFEDELVRVTSGITKAMQVLQDHQTQEESCRLCMETNCCNSKV